MGVVMVMCRKRRGRGGGELGRGISGDAKVVLVICCWSWP